MSFQECREVRWLLSQVSIVEMVHALRSIDREAFELLTKKRFDDFWRKINGNFLLAVFAGIVTSLFTIAR